MADEKDQQQQPNTQNQQQQKQTQMADKPTFETKDQLMTFLFDLQGQMQNMQQVIDKMAPVENNSQDDQGEGGEKEVGGTDEEVNEIDSLLQS